jgi:hypothetical protein
MNASNRADLPPVEDACAFKDEVMLAGWQETHSGGAKVTFWLASSEALEPFRLATVRKGKVAGQRYMCVLVEIDTDERPVHHVSNDAHLMIMGERFQEYAKFAAPAAALIGPERVREWAKWKMGVDSLSELDHDPGAVARFHELVRKPFLRWGEQAGEDHGNDDAADRDDVDEGQPC